MSYTNWLGKLVGQYQVLENAKEAELFYEGVRHMNWEDHFEKVKLHMPKSMMQQATFGVVPFYCMNVCLKNVHSNTMDKAITCKNYSYVHQC